MKKDVLKSIFQGFLGAGLVYLWSVLIFGMGA